MIAAECKMLFVPFVFCGIIATGQAGSAEGFRYSETTIVSMEPGAGAGQYIHRQGGGLILSPRCFAIDPNDGAFYIPETNIHGNIRIHQFDKTGTFRRMVIAEGKAVWIFSIAVTGSGDILLNAAHPLEATRTVIAHYDKAGRLLRKLGPQGPITETDSLAEIAAIAQFEEFPHPEKYFDRIVDLVLAQEQDVYAVSGRPHWEGSVVRFNIPSGIVKEKLAKASDLPSAIVDKKLRYLASRERLLKMLSQEKRLFGSGLAATLVTSDNVVYYMGVKTDRLEIRKVEFAEPPQ